MLTPQLLAEIDANIPVVKDFPIKGILFRDITNIFFQPRLVIAIVDELAAHAQDVGAEVILAPESRGFLFGVPVALKLGIAFVLARKPGKLPRPTISADYQLEYGQNTFHIHADAIAPGKKVLVIDDLLATGGTTSCLEKLVTQFQACPVGSAYLIELLDLKGQQKISKPVFSIIKY